MGRLRTASFQVDPEQLLRALVETPMPIVARLIGVSAVDWIAEQAGITTELAAAQTKREKNAVKLRIPALVPGRFKGEERSKAECIERQIIGHDFDAIPGETWLDVITRVRELLPDRFVAFHTTATVRNEDGTWRVRAYEILDRPATPTQWDAHVKTHMRRLGETDANALDVTRLLYMPIVTIGYQSAVLEGPRTKLDDILALPPDSPPATTSTAPLQNCNPPGATTASAAALLASAWPPTGKRNGALLTLAGALSHQGWTEDEALAFVREMYEHVDPNVDPTELETTVSNSYRATQEGKHVTGWTTLGTMIPPSIVSAARGLLDVNADGKARFKEEFQRRDIAADIGIPIIASNSINPESLPNLSLKDRLAAQRGGKDPEPVVAAGPPIVWGGWDEPILPPVYLLEGLIPEAKVVAFYAEGGSVKTWSAFDLAISVATGRPWLGKYPVKQGKALYLDFEDGRYEFQRRSRILLGGLEPLPDLGYWYCDRRLTEVDLWKQLAPLDLKLLVIDALNSGMPAGTDENDNAFSEAVKLAGRFTAVGCTVVIIHHANKTGGMRGHSSVRDQCDVVFKFDPVSETDDVKRMRMVCDKPGPQKKPQPVNVELSDKGLTTFEDEANDMGRNATGERDVKAAVLLALGSEGPMVLQALVTRVACRRQSVLEAVRELEEGGRIVKLDRLGWDLDDDTKRRTRILASAPNCSSSSELIDAAFVKRSDVEAAIKAGVIVLRTGREGGGFIVP